MEKILRIGALIIVIGLFVYIGLQVIGWQQNRLDQRALSPVITGNVAGQLLRDVFILESVNPLNPDPWNISCQSSGENSDPTIMGTTVYDTPFYQYNKTDYCENEHYLNEFWCDEFSLAKRSYGLCIFGCNEGACTLVE